MNATHNAGRMEMGTMKAYNYCTDSEKGTVEAVSLAAALAAARKESGVTDAAILDGAFCWVEDQGTGERAGVGKSF